MATKEQRVGPKVKVDITYECNGCRWHQVDHDEDDDTKHHACHHPAILEEYACSQWFGFADKALTVYHPAPTPAWMCPYIRDKD